MKNPIRRNIDLIFYVFMAISFVLLLLPPKYNMAIYTPNLLGFFGC